MSLPYTLVSSGHESHSYSWQYDMQKHKRKDTLQCQIQEVAQYSMTLRVATISLK